MMKKKNVVKKRGGGMMKMMGGGGVSPRSYGYGNETWRSCKIKEKICR